MSCSCRNGQKSKVPLHTPPWTLFASKCQTWAYEHSTEYSYRGYMDVSEGNKSFKYSDPVRCTMVPLDHNRAKGQTHTVYVRLTRRFSAKHSVLQTQQVKSPSPIRLEVSASGAGNWECGIKWLQRLALAAPYSCVARQAVKGDYQERYPYFLKSGPTLDEGESRTVTLDRPFPLMRLASGLRLKIFEFATDEMRGERSRKLKLFVSKPCHSCKSRKVRAAGRLTVDHNFMFLNRRIYDEVRKQCYSTTVFHFSDHVALRIFLHQISPNNTILLRKLSFDIGVAFVLFWDAGPRNFNSRRQGQVRKYLTKFAGVSRDLSTYLCQQAHLDLQRLTVDARLEDRSMSHMNSYSFGWASSRIDSQENVYARATSNTRILQKIAEEFGRRLGDKMPDCTVKVRVPSPEF